MQREYKRRQLSGAEHKKSVKIMHSASLRRAAAARTQLDAEIFIMRFRLISTAIVVGTIISLAAFESPAQFGGGVPGGGTRGNRARPDGAAREQRPPVQDNSPEQIEDRLGMLEEDLQLRPDQRAAWQACEEKVMAYAADIGREQTRGLPSAATLSSIQQIEHTVDVARNRLTALEDIASAAKTL